MAGDKDDYDLLIEMRKATRRSHNIANALILSKLVVVLTDKGLYARALSSFLPVYSKLEALLQQHKDVPGLSTVVAVTSTIPARTAAMEQVCMQQLLLVQAVLLGGTASKQSQYLLLLQLHSRRFSTVAMNFQQTLLSQVLWCVFVTTKS
jgi:hypothetical protein